MLLKLCRSAVVTVVCATAGYATTIFYTPSAAYLQSSDSPFAANAFTWFYLNDFEANTLASSPGAIANAGDTAINSGFSGPIIDSVDADDGHVDGQCVNCNSWFSGGGAVTWTFDATTLGALPTSVGLVWTDGGGTVTFNAYGPGMVLLGTRTNADGGWVPGPGVSDQDVNEDHFFGVSDPGGIMAISISNTSGGIEIDHLQYGLAGGLATPEPGTLSLLGVTLGAIGLIRFRRKR